jgi:hypothetical protein
MTQAEMQQELGRAKNAIQDYLIRKLVVPKVYLDADWNGKSVDVLAIDRAGVGDVHAVRIVFDDSIGEEVIWKVRNSVNEFKSHLSHYRYVAVVHDKPYIRGFTPVEESAIRSSFADDGVGRIGVLNIDLTEDDPPSVRVILKPERFRSSKEIVDLADRYVAEHTANWEIRE